MNKVILVGRIGKDPEQFTFNDGNKKSSFSVATSDSYKDKSSGEWIETTDWHNIVKNGETKLIKGDLVSIDGKLKVRKWTDKSGDTKYATEVVAYRVDLLHRNNKSYSPEDSHKQKEDVGVKQSPDYNEQNNDLPF